MQGITGIKTVIIAVMLILLSLCVIYPAPNSKAQGPYGNISSLSKIIEIPPGESYYAYFDRGSNSIVEMELPAPEAGLSLKAKSALARVPGWLYEDLANKFAELGDTNVDVGDFATPVLSDMDADGDLDLSLGSNEGTIHYYENVGTKYRPIFVENSDMYLNISEEWSPGKSRTALAIADLDADGDNDLIIGYDVPQLYYFENIGTPTQAEWDSGTLLPGIGAGVANSHPAIADLDSDGDFDLAVGGADGYIYFYENIGTPESPNWQADYQVYTGEEDDRKPFFGDMDDDGDLDLTIGDGNSPTIHFYRNIGSPTGEDWLPEPTMYIGVNPEDGTSPAIADLNGDLRLDLIVGGTSGRCFLYRNSGTALSPEWLIWSSYHVVEGYNYYPKEVFLTYRNDHHMDRFADLIIYSEAKYRDEIGFAIAHMPTENLKSMNDNQTHLFVDNAELIYQIDQYLDYVEVIEKDDYTTTRYKFGEPESTITRELPRDIYYWFIVHPKITDEPVYYIHPDDTNPDNPTDPIDGGRFWREYLFYHNDSAYPPDLSDVPGDGIDDYPLDRGPPLLMALLDDITTLWNGTSWNAPGGRSDYYGKNALIRVSNWVGWTLVLNQQEVSDDERPIQPVRIAHHHNGNCGELQDLTTAASRTALIPAAGVLLLGEDHVWIEFFESGWHQWDNYWSHGGSIIDNFDNYWGGWGQRGGSGIHKHGGDDDAWEVTDHYIPEEALNYVTIRVRDRDGYPVDGARVIVLSYWLSVTIQGYQVDIPFPGIWNYTDSKGETLFKLAVQEKPNGNKNFTFRIVSKVGYAESGKIELERGQDYTFTYNLEGSAPTPVLNTNPQFPPNPPEPTYILSVDYEVKGGSQQARHLQTGNYHPEELPPYRAPEPYGGNFPGNNIESFLANEVEFENFLKGYIFESYEFRGNWRSDSFVFEIVDEERLYFVFSNRDSIETTKIIELNMELYRPEPYTVVIMDPKDNVQFPIGDLVEISGYVANSTELVSLDISTDNGKTWTSLGTGDNQWVFQWDTTPLTTGIYTIQVKADYGSNVSYDSIDIELMDLEPPSIQILAPSQNSQHNIGSIVTISGTASDNLGIEMLKLSTNGGNKWLDILHELQNDAWSYEWDTADLDPDYYLIMVKASDGAHEVQDLRWVDIRDLESPSVYFTDPVEGEKVGINITVTITGAASDNIGIVGLKLSLDGGETWVDIFQSLNDGTWFYSWDTTGLSLGAYTLMVEAYDGIYYTTSSIQIELAELGKPSVTILSPKAYSRINIGSTIQINGKAWDDIDIEELYLSTNDGKNWMSIIAKLNDENWSYDWSTEGLDKGIYTITVKASDGSFTVKDSITIQLVDSEPPELAFISPPQDSQFEVGGTIQLSGTAVDNMDIEELELSFDNGSTWQDIFPNLIDEQWNLYWNTESFVPGTYDILIRGSDGENRAIQSLKIILMDSKAPSLRITSPPENSKHKLGSIITIVGIASDDVGMVTLFLQIDDSSWREIDIPGFDEGQWSYELNTLELRAGYHVITVKCSDGYNEVEESLRIELEEEEPVSAGPLDTLGDALVSYWFLWVILVVWIIFMLIYVVRGRRREESSTVEVVEVEVE